MADAHGAAPDYRIDHSLAEREHLGSERLARGFLVRLLDKHFGDRDRPSIRILDVGCGLGVAVRHLRDLGYDAWGLEPGGRYNDITPDIRPFIHNCYAHELGARHPGSGLFDLVMSHGVVEHVGTTDGAAALAPDFKSWRRQFLQSQIDLLKPGGLLLTCGPNRLFFFDFQHGPQSYGLLGELKSAVPALKPLTIPWDRRNHLVSYTDLAELVDRTRVTLLSERQHDYLSLASLERRPALSAIFRAYIGIVSALPSAIRRPFETHTLFLCRLNPTD